MFSVRLVARPDARMVEVPLEIEVELPREFDGVALLSSSGLPRRVKLRAQKDALKLSTAYKAEQLVADIVRTTLRASAQDVQRVHDAVKVFLRSVRDKRQDGATFVVSASGTGKIDLLSPAGAAQPAPGTGPIPQAHAPSDKRIGELESALRLSDERVAALERKLQQVEAQLGRSALIAGVAGPGLDARGPGQPVAKRASAIEAFADALRAELRGRIQKLREAHRADTERANRAAALAAEAQQVLHADAGDTPSKLRETAAQGTSFISAIDRLGEEVELYDASELMIATQLLGRLEKTERPQDPAPSLEAVARAVVSSASTSAEARDEWLGRATALLGRTLAAPEVAPAPPEPVMVTPEPAMSTPEPVAPPPAAPDAITPPLGTPRIVEVDPATQDPALSHADTSTVEEVLDEDVEELSELPPQKH